MKNKIKKYKLGFFAGLLFMGMGLVSCEEYLDKAPEATITDNDVFGNFVSFQGFAEQMYICPVDYNHNLGGNTMSFCFADEVLNNTPTLYDDGDYTNQGRLFTGALNLQNNVDPGNKKIWPLSWYGIRKANLGLSKLDLLNGTQEEKDIIKGQCLFYRAWFHFELMRFYGGLPYIDTVLTVTDDLKLPRLNYRETALKAAKDFEEAAALLPVKWDDTQVGQATLGDNSQRISKIHALAYLGKDLLYAASPMMNEESTGSNTYDADLCKQAADAFAEVIKICDETGAYKLQSWETWTENFWEWSTTIRPGGTEAIMSPIYYRTFSRWTTVRTSSPVQFSAGNTRVEVPTENYVKNYGMANGLPIDDPLSGYNPNDPWVNRDPRFYKDIVVDGDRMVMSNSAGINQYAQLNNGGLHRGGTIGSVTGYFRKKWTPVGCNPWDNKWDYTKFENNCPFMRLADVYLMYAEAVLQGYGTPQSSVPGSITAEQAVNIIRNRAQLPDLTSSYTATKEKFMEAIIRERAVELAFEGHRFFDLRRWNISGNAKYLQKTAIDFDRGTDGKPVNLRERVVVTRVFAKKNNWMPFPVSVTKLYPGFKQNPGW